MRPQLGIPAASLIQLRGFGGQVRHGVVDREPDPPVKSAALDPS